MVFLWVSPSAIVAINCHFTHIQALLWKELVVDFGHELVTAIHMPLMWSNERPNAEEYTAAFHRVSLSSSKVNENVDYFIQLTDGDSFCTLDH
jgi:hypothetical protein